MNIQIRFVDIDKDEKLSDYAKQKVTEVLKKFSKNFTKQQSILAVIELSKTSEHHQQGAMYKAGLNVEGFQELIHVEAVTDDFYKSVDQLRDRLQEVIANQKSKQASLARKFGSQFKNFFQRN